MDILNEVIEIVKDVMETDEVDADTLMEDDLEIASLEFYELLSRLEKKFSIKMPEKVLSNVETVDDIAYEVETIMKKKGLL
ncbi:MAG: acyl carrier protein [Lachnospiraceae bacterium]|nr:acyl carrier protein [Lachnospiraceae bacterium]